MKKCLTAFILSFLLYGIAVAQSPQIQKGTKLIYHVITTDKEYDYVVTVNSFGPAISFSWKMTAPVNTSGKVSLLAGALQSAVSYKNYFSNASDEKLADQSTVWLSKKNFNELRSASKTNMDMTGKMLEYVKNPDAVTASYSLKGVSKNAKVINAQYKQAGDAVYTVNVFDDPRNPLIQYMSLEGFTITLKSVE